MEAKRVPIPGLWVDGGGYTTAYACPPGAGWLQTGQSHQSLGFAMSSAGQEGSRAVLGAKWFATTHWSVVLSAVDDSSPGAKEALEHLCRTYWYPLYAYVRRQGHSPEDAQDLTQAFFVRFLAKKSVQLADPQRGKFRSFLLTSLKHFLTHEWERARAVKRGGGQIHLSWDQTSAENQYQLEPAS